MNPAGNSPSLRVSRILVVDDHPITRQGVTLRIQAEPDLKERLMRAIDALSESYRTTFVMHDIEGYTHEEIGAALAERAEVSDIDIVPLEPALDDFNDDLQLLGREQLAAAVRAQLSVGDRQRFLR